MNLSCFGIRCTFQASRYGVKLKINFLSSKPKHVVGNQKNPLNEMVVFRTPKLVKTDGFECIHNYTLNVFNYLELNFVSTNIIPKMFPKPGIFGLS